MRIAGSLFLIPRWPLLTGATAYAMKIRLGQPRLSLARIFIANPFAKQGRGGLPVVELTRPRP